MALLKLIGVSKSFGGLAAISDLNLEVGRGEIRGVVGPNGAGKTTLLNMISGFLRPTRGKIVYEGRDIHRLKPSARARLGLVRTFQGNNIFAEFSVLKTVMMGRHMHAGDREARAAELLDLMGISGIRNEAAIDLSHGQQRIMSIALALAAEPKLLMLDEPTSGLSWEEASAVVSAIRRVHELGTSIVLVEHDMRIIMNLCDRISVFNFGEKIAEGAPEDIQRNQDVIDAYLGDKNLLRFF